METVKINNNQNIVEKHFKYTDLFNIDDTLYNICAFSFIKIPITLHSS